MSGSDDILGRFHPVVAAWFRARFGEPTEPQRRGWPAIGAGRDALIAAPTGSGKTLAAFLACLDELIRRGLAGGLPDRVEILYISPLKALSNDVQRNLEAPLRELEATAAREGLRLPEIRCAVRTGDTPATERAKMARRPPHILVTTPESLYILLTAERSRQALAHVRTVIVDEIHAVAPDKRGAHLALSLERLDRLVTQAQNRAPVRIGLSATQKPIERIGRLLVGAGRPMPEIIDGGHARDIDVAIELTDDELGAIASHEQMGRIYDRIAELVGEHHTTLVFANTRRMVERVAHALEDRLGAEQVVAHHGSMSRQLRFAAEQKLKAGAVRCAVATASLELGIDVGAVDLVVQIGSPRSIATFLQRVGRSGHSLGATPKGRLFATTRDQLVECAALIRALRARRLDAIELREAPLDILAQQIVACAASEELGEDELFALVRRATQYAELARKDFDAIVEMLAEGISDRRGRATAHLHRDRVNARVKARRGARLAAITSGGAIPDNANYPVVLYPDEVKIGELDEDFAIESLAGDVFLLGNRPWRIRRVEAGRVIVEDAAGLQPNIPFWVAEAPARTAELSEEVARLRAEVEARLVDGQGQAQIAAWLVHEAALPRPGAELLVAYLAASRTILGALPTHDTLVAERFFDEGGGMQLVIHSPLGGRINKAWGLALRKRFCRSFNFELQAAATDDGIVISLGQPHSFPLEDVFRFLPSPSCEEVLVQATLDAPVFGVRWRWNATRALAILRRHGGKKVAPHLVRMRSDDLLSVVFPMQQACLENVVGDREVPDHPLVAETLRDCLTEAMDGPGLRRIIERIERGELRVVAVDTVEPSPLCHELVNANPYAFLDDAPAEERRTRAVALRRGLPSSAAAGDFGRLDGAAIAAAAEEVTPAVRDPDELHDALLSLYLVQESRDPRSRAWEAWLEPLLAAGRATRVDYACGSSAYRAWVAAERLPIVLAALPAEVRLDPTMPPLPFAVTVPERDEAIRTLVAACLDYSGPRTAPAIAGDLGLPEADVEAALAALEADGAVLRGHFSPNLGDTIEWCNRRVLARIHRLTLARLRSEIEPVDAAALMRFLFRWQRVAAGHQLIGADGLGRVVEQLQGFETAAGAWEREVLPARLHQYEPAWLDSLCLSGQVAWCRLSPKRRAATASASEAGDSASMDVAVGDDPSAEIPAELVFECDPAIAADLFGGGAPAAEAARPMTPAPATAAARATAAPTKAAPLALMLRQDLAWLRAAAPWNDAVADELGAGARAVYDHLRERGASFLADLVGATGLDPHEVEEALWELVGAGLASADGFASLRLLVDRGRGEVRSHFDALRRSSAPQHGKWQDALRKARRRDSRRPSQAMHALPTAAGRWSLLGPPDAAALDADAHARQLLHRYGVVFRDLLARESALPPWRDILVALRRLEARGEIRGGRFVAGFVGEQYALPEAVEGLRAMRRPPAIPELVRIPATDPLNLVGITGPGPRVPALIGNAILYRDGVPLASLEGGERVLRADLPDGARVDRELVYHAPPRRQDPAQISLRLIS